MPKRFVYRLEPLLKLKDALEKEAQRSLARCLQTLRDTETRLLDLEHRAQAAWMLRQAGPGEAVDLERWRAVERYLVVTERAIVQAREDLAQAEAQVAEARAELTRAHQARMTLLRLKEKLQAQHALDLAHEDLLAADDMAVLRHRFTRPAPAAS